MRFILVSTEDPSIKKTVEIPKEIISVESEESVKPLPKPQITKHKKPRKSYQTSKSFVHG